MNLSNMTFWEMAFNGRYHIIMGLLFVIFFGVFLYEVAVSILAAYKERRTVSASRSFPLIIRNEFLGETLLDGGEPVEKKTGEDSIEQ